MFYWSNAGFDQRIIGSIERVSRWGVGRVGLEPTTNALKGRCSTIELPTRRELPFLDQFTGRRKLPASRALRLQRRAEIAERIARAIELEHRHSGVRRAFPILHRIVADVHRFVG